MRHPLTLRVHALLERSYANGPAGRAAIWVQGCTIRCPGCCNPDAQDPAGGRAMTVTALLDWVRAVDGVEGITVSGGEPLQQPGAVAALLREVRQATNLSVVLFTGLDWDQVLGEPRLTALTHLADVVIAGPYRRRLRLDRGLRASANQTVHLLTGRYTVADLMAVPEAEVVLDEHRSVLTGVNDATLS